jgi:F-type H+-transporting ATPase subunit delta
LADDISGSGPITSGIAGRYASALFELASEAGRIEEVGRGLAAFDALVAESADLERLVRSPAFSAEEQTAAVAAILARAGITGLAANFIKLVASKRRLFAVRGMAAAYQALADARAGVVKAEVRVAKPLSEQNRRAVQEALDGVTGKSVRVEEKVDPSLIGGLVVKMGSKMIDSSVRTKLNSLKAAMKEAV